MPKLYRKIKWVTKGVGAFHFICIPLFLSSSYHSNSDEDYDKGLMMVEVAYNTM